MVSIHRDRAFPSGTSSAGIFMGTPGAVQTVALQNTTTPTGDATFASFATSPLPNGQGQVAFVANLAGNITAGVNDAALFAGSPGALSLIVRKGDVIDVDPTAGIDDRTVTAIALLIGSGGQDGKGTPFNDSGLITYKLTLTQNDVNGNPVTSTGIFTSLVPEPASLSLLAVAGFGLLRRRHRNDYPVAG